MSKDRAKELWMIIEELKSWGALLCGGNDLGIECGELNGLGLRLGVIAGQLERLKDEIE